MHLVTDIISWASHNRHDLWIVVVVALVVAWLERGGHISRMRGYDAWWFFNLRRSDTKTVHRSSRDSGVG